MTSVQKNAIAELGTEFIGADGRKTILLEPEKWLGKECPLFPCLESSNGARKTPNTNEWSIALVRNDCEECKDFLKTLSAKEKSRLMIASVSEKYGETQQTNEEIAIV